LLILNRAGMDTMQRDGRILPGSEVTLASSPAAIAVRSGAPHPDISSAEALNAKNRFPPPAGLCAEFLPTGEVELAIQQTPELKQVPGIEIVGPLPAPYALVT